MANPFFPALLVNDTTLSFEHLEPFQFKMVTAARPNGATVDVRFSNHCFSEAYEATRHADPVVEVWDRGQRRIFDQGRYDLSFGLRGIIEDLPAKPVFYTPESNFVCINAPSVNGPQEYRVYFNAKRGGHAGSDVSLFIESAYPPNFGKQVLSPAQMTKVRFAILIDKTIRGEKLRFQYKR